VARLAGEATLAAEQALHQELAAHADAQKLMAEIAQQRLQQEQQLLKAQQERIAAEQALVAMLTAKQEAEVAAAAEVQARLNAEAEQVELLAARKNSDEEARLAIENLNTKEKEWLAQAAEEALIKRQTAAALEEKPPYCWNPAVQSNNASRPSNN
jgi:hypothetical protein